MVIVEIVIEWLLLEMSIFPLLLFVKQGKVPFFMRKMALGKVLYHWLSDS